MTSRSRIALALLPVLAVSTLCLTGCSGMGDAARLVQKNYHEESFATLAQAKTDWVGVKAPQWLPTGATDIHNRATNNEALSVIAVRSNATLPSWCTEADRRQLPYTTTSWAPAPKRFPDKVADCGDYEVMKVDDGYLGWYSATVEGQKPLAGPQS